MERSRVPFAALHFVVCAPLYDKITRSSCVLFSFQKLHLTSYTAPPVMEELKERFFASAFASKDRHVPPAESKMCMKTFCKSDGDSPDVVGTFNASQEELVAAGGFDMLRDCMARIGIRLYIDKKTTWSYALSGYVLKSSLANTWFNTLKQLAKARTHDDLAWYSFWCRMCHVYQGQAIFHHLDNSHFEDLNEDRYRRYLAWVVDRCGLFHLVPILKTRADWVAGIFSLQQQKDLAKAMGLELVFEDEKTFLLLGVKARTSKRWCGERPSPYVLLPNDRDMDLAAKGVRKLSGHGGDVTILKGKEPVEKVKPFLHNPAPPSGVAAPTRHRVVPMPATPLEKIHEDAEAVHSTHVLKDDLKKSATVIATSNETLPVTVSSL